MCQSVASNVQVQMHDDCMQDAFWQSLNLPADACAGLLLRMA